MSVIVVKPLDSPLVVAKPAASPVIVTVRDAMAYRLKSVLITAADVAADVATQAELDAVSAGSVTLSTAQVITGLKTHQASAPGNVGLIVQGAVGQTANLFEARTSANTVVARVAPNGDITGNVLTAAQVTVTSAFVLRDVNSNTIITQETTGLSNRLLIIGNSTYSAIRFNLATNNSRGVDIGGTTNFTIARFAVHLSDVSQVGQIIRGAAAQTADLQQWQSDTGVVLASMGPGMGGTNVRLSLRHVASATPGQVSALRIGTTSQEWTSIRTDGDGAFSLDMWDGTAFVHRLSAGMGSTGKIGLIVKSVVGQTGDLQQWQNSAATALARIGSAGDIGAASIANVAWTSPYIDFITSSVRVTNRNAVANIPLLIRSMAGQTGDLQQWQDSTGVILAALKVSTNTHLFLDQPTGSTGNTFISLRVQGQQDWSFGVDRADTSKFKVSNSTVLGTNDRLVFGTATSHAALIIRGIVSQTGDLQQWQNSATAVLTSINAAGLIRWNAAANEQITVGAAGAASVLPANPTKYLKVVGSGGESLVIPAYAAA